MCERDWNYPVVPTSVHPTVNKLNVPVILSLEIPSVQYRWHNSRLNNVSSKGLCWCKCIYRQMWVCTFINSMFSPTGKTERTTQRVYLHTAEVWKYTGRNKKKTIQLKTELVSYMFSDCTIQFTSPYCLACFSTVEKPGHLQVHKSYTSFTWNMQFRFSHHNIPPDLANHNPQHCQC